MFLFPASGAIRLRTIREEDAPAYWQLYHRQALANGERIVQSAEDARTFLRRIQSLCELLFAIEMPFSPLLLIGDCALHHWEKEGRSIEFGGTLLPPYQGRGVMQEVLSVLQPIATTQFNARFLQAATEETNKKAIRFALKNGFSSVEICNGQLRFQKILFPESLP